MKIFYTSDLHLGHETVSKLRGFQTTDNHDEKIIENWLSAVSKGDIVWVLGDVTGTSKDVEYALSILTQLPGQKHLIAGNHDKCWAGHRNGYKHIHKYLEVFDSVQSFGVRKTHGQRFMLSHFPYEGDHTEGSRYDEFRLPDMTTPILHGHTHSDKTHSITGKSTPQLHVGLDGWNLKPVSENAMIELWNTIK